MFMGDMTAKSCTWIRGDPFNCIAGHKAVDRAVSYSALATVTRILAGPFTAVLVATRLSPETQGYYFTFFSLLAVQVFVELGLGQVTVQFASHEWSRLGLEADGRVSGAPDAM